MAGASLSGTTTWESQILSYKVFIFLCCIGHPNIVTHEFAHFPGRDDPLFGFFTAGPALQIRCAVAAAQYFDNRTFTFSGFAVSLERLIQQHRNRVDSV